MIESRCSYVLIASKTDTYKLILSRESDAQSPMNMHQRSKKELVQHVRCTQPQRLEMSPARPKSRVLECLNPAAHRALESSFTNFVSPSFCALGFSLSARFQPLRWLTPTVRYDAKPNQATYGMRQYEAMGSTLDQT